MVQSLISLMIITLFALAFILISDSDDDSSGGGLMQPKLLPISTREKASR